MITENYDRTKSVLVNNTPIQLRVKAAEKSNTPALFPEGSNFIGVAPCQMILGFSNSPASLHDAFTIGQDTYEILNPNSGTPADYTLSLDGNIPIALTPGSNYSTVSAEVTTAINNTRSSYSGSNAYLLSDGVTPKPFVNGTENLFAIDLSVDNVAAEKVVILTNALTPGGQLTNSNRSLSTSVGSLQLMLNTFNSQSPMTEVYPGTQGTTSAIDSRIEADVDPSGSETWLETFKIEVTPNLDHASGTLSLVINVTPKNGVGAYLTPILSETVTHPQSMDNFQASAGFARQP